MLEGVSNIIHSNKFIRRILIAFSTIVALFVVASLSSSVSASDGKVSSSSKGSTLMQAFTPHRDSVTGQLVSRVNNTSHERFEGWVCATEMHGSRKAHLGCLKVNLDPVYGSNYSFQFGVTTKMGGSVHYTYQNMNGAWRAVAPAVH